MFTHYRNVNLARPELVIFHGVLINSLSLRSGQVMASMFAANIQPIIG